MSELVNMKFSVVHGSVGRWLYSVVSPPDTRMFKFYLMAKSHNTNASAVRSTDDFGHVVIEPVKVYGVKFELTELPEGEFAAEPTLTAPFESYYNPPGIEPGNDIEQCLQALSDCAASMGIYPSGAKDTTKELATLRAHLEDMRALVGVRPREVGKL